MLKIDLQKAFDSVHWDFVKELLFKLKFPEVFIKWIMSYVTLIQFNIQLNGHDCGAFEGGRTQTRWPTIPLLFVLSMEYLSRLMNMINNGPDF